MYFPNRGCVRPLRHLYGYATDCRCLRIYRGGEQEEEGGGGDKEQSETENDLGQTGHHRRDGQVADAEMEAVLRATVRRRGRSTHRAPAPNAHHCQLTDSFIHLFVRLFNFLVRLNSTYSHTHPFNGPFSATASR